MTLKLENPSRLPKEFIVFYCWQDQMEKKSHRYLIRDALNAAVGDVQNMLPDNLECNIKPDSDTAERAGSVAICDTILEKIGKSTIVIADVTPVLKIKTRKLYFPNPNVMMEIGYAAKALGWSRVNCIYNDAGCSPEHLPFDIRHRRLTNYTCATPADRKDALKKLTAILVAVITAAMQEIDRGEFKESLENTNATRKRDLRLLTDLLNTIHTPSLDNYIQTGMQDGYYDVNGFFWIGFEAIVCSSNFRFYDKKLERLIRELGGIWGRAEYISGLVLHPTGNPGQYGTKEHRYWTPEYEQKLNDMRSAFRALAGKLRAFLDYVHENYPEIDLTVTNEAAWKSNLPYIRGDMFDNDASARKTPTKKEAP